MALIVALLGRSQDSVILRRRGVPTPVAGQPIFWKERGHAREKKRCSAREKALLTIAQKSRTAPIDGPEESRGAGYRPGKGR